MKLSAYACRLPVHVRVRGPAVTAGRAGHRDWAAGLDGGQRPACPSCFHASSARAGRGHLPARLDGLPADRAGTAGPGCSAREEARWWRDAALRLRDHQVRSGLPRRQGPLHRSPGPDERPRPPRGGVPAGNGRLRGETGVSQLAIREPQVAASVHFGLEPPIAGHGLAGLFPPDLTGYHDGAVVPVPVAVKLVRAMLRDNGAWCRLEAEGQLTVHVGWDQYLWVASTVPCQAALARAREAGLFPERVDASRTRSRRTRLRCSGPPGTSSGPGWPGASRPGRPRSWKKARHTT